MVKYRTERDTMGEMKIPATALFGAQTQRAVENFTITQDVMPWSFIDAVLHIKLAAAKTNGDLGLLTKEQSIRICTAVDFILERKPLDQFPVSVYQTGSGTSTNMNVNEVIAKISSQKDAPISANDHINLCQSSNDVIPSAIQISAARKTTQQLIPALKSLIQTINGFANNHRDVIKTGRTHLMDALPIKLIDECKAWSSQLEECIERLESALPRLMRLPLGGTAVGSGANCHPEFAKKTIRTLSRILELDFTQARSLFKGLSSLDSVVEHMSHLKTCAICMSKIANDLRFMNSGPHNGFGEIQLPALQPGSSIMPAKINPVIPEAVLMAAARVIGNDATMSIAGLGGNFQLNTMLPLAAATILESINLLSESAHALSEKTIKGITVNRDKLASALPHNPILVTSLTPYIGYNKAAEIAKIAEKERRPLIEVALEQTEIPKEKLQQLLDPQHLADGGLATHT
ncbi:class II fumarate hydratase [Desulforhopalus sp. IMCC35007]|nr:class II fumarate hydratase [Desulforhopalus sp. IMCC35007]